jgi:cell wall-associated NlpC family hydrolase
MAVTGFARRRTVLVAAAGGAAALLLVACSSAPVSVPVASTATPATANSERSRLTLDQANDVTLYAISLVGTPYRYGGNTPQSGFDCSGLIGHVYASRAGVKAPRTVTALNDWGQPVPAAQVRTGDLVLFSQGLGAATHAGIYVGEGRFVHAPSSGGEVRLELLSAKHWARQQLSYRRP